MFTRKAKAEAVETAEDSRAALRAASFAATATPIVLVDTKDLVLDFNDAAEKLVGKAPKIGEPVASLWSETRGEAVIRGRAHAMQRSQITGEAYAITLRPVSEHREVLQQAEGRFSNAVGKIQTKMRELADFVASISHIAEEAGHSAAEMDGKIEGVSSTFEIVAAAAQELDASIAEITRQASQSSNEAEAAVERTEAANVTVRQLAESSERIGEVVGLIEEIAAQTNLLALNATIEAARAGEAGRGFAVVAAEVKNLAQQTTKATGDITQQISTIQSNIGDAVDAIDGINTTIKQISSVSTSIAGAVGQQSSATADISRNVLLAAENIRGVSESLAAVSKASRETPEQLRQVVSATEEAIRVNQDLGTEITDLVETVRKAAG